MDVELDNEPPPMCGDEGCSQALYIGHATPEFDPYLEEGTPVYMLSCPDSGGKCYEAKFHSPHKNKKRDFHPHRLQEATEAINHILNKLDPPPHRALRVIAVPGGLMLAWAMPEGKIPAEGVVTSESPREERMEMYGLED